MRKSIVFIYLLLTALFSLNVSSVLAQDYQATINVDLCEGQTFHIRHKVVNTAGVYYDTLLSKSATDSIIRYVVTFHSFYQFNDTVTICEGESYTFEGHQYTEEGDYYANLKAQGGCDSIRHLHLIIKPTYRINIDTTVCGSIFYFRGKPYMQSGDYYDSLKTKLGCDSIIRLSLTLVNIPVTDIQLTVCEGDSVFIGDRLLPAMGTYYDTIISHQGCDSVIRYTFRTLKPYLFEQTATICAGETYKFFDQMLTEEGDYYANFKTANGNCDSIYHLRLNTKPTYRINIDTTVCGSIFYFRGKPYMQSGDYYDSLKTKTGCDSIIRLSLTLVNIPITDIRLTVCEGDSVYIGDRHLPAMGVYYDTLLSYQGCDSVIRYTFNILQPYLFEQSATICAGGTYKFFDRILTAPGDYYENLKTTNGCDSIYHLHLSLSTVHYIVIDTVVCGNTCIFHNKTYTESGTYYDTISSTHGCDSVFELNLAITHSVYTNVDMDVCEGDSVWIRDRHIPARGLFYDTLVAKSGCDSIIRYRFNVFPNYTFQHIATICDGETYNFFGQTLTSPGHYTHTFQTIHGCDSTYHLDLTVNPVELIIVDTSLCAKSFIFNNHTYTESGTYYDTLQTEQGCHSIYQLNLNLHKPSPVIDVNVSLCEGDSFFIRGKKIPTTSFYYDSLLDRHGCDSVVRYIFNFHPVYDIYDTVSICQGDYYDFGGNKVTEDGDYTLPHKTISGCDSTIHLHLTTRPNYLTVIDTTLCANEFVFNHHTYTESGTYYDTIQSTLGCDSVLKLNLYLHKLSPVTDVNVSLCQGDSFFIRGKQIPTTSLYYDTLYNQDGCDSVVRYIFNVHPVFEIYDSVTICKGDYYEFGGRKITEAGLYTLNHQTVAGCDSTIHLILATREAHYYELDTTVCGNHFIFNHHTYTESGIYTDTIQTTLGCDSVLRLDLKLYPAIPITDVNISLCQGDSFFIRGKQIPTTTIYYDSLLSTHGCDSVVRYIFNVLPTFEIYDSVNICKGDYYDFGGRKLTEAGEYTITEKTINGCDSTIHLILTTNDTHYYSLDTIICGDFFIFNNHTYTESGLYEDTISTTQGCDSLLRLNLILYPQIPVTDIPVTICHGDSFSIAGSNISLPGIYYDSLLSTHGCDSVIRYIINVLPTYQFYDTVSICDYETYLYQNEVISAPGDYNWQYQASNGCDSAYHLHLVVHPSYFYVTDTIVCGRTFRFQNRDYTQSGTYDHIYKTVHGCDSLYRLNLRLDTGVVTDIHLDVCEGDSMYISGKNVPARGIYCDTLISRTGCDSIVRYIFNVHNTFEFYETATICSNEKYYFFGDSLYNEGDYTKVFQTENFGCDSIYHLHLEVLNSYLFIIDTIACGNTFRFRNKDYVASGRYVDSLLTVGGCDSVYILNLTLHPVHTTDIHLDVCDGDSMYISGKNIPARGIYCDTLLTVGGCDSIVRYIFNVHNTFEFYQVATICSGETYNFFGDILSNEGDYTKVFTTRYGCDSTYHLHLTINPSYLFVLDTVVCGHTFRFRNRDYTATGHYVDSLRTAEGCDSVYILDLILHKPSPLTEFNISLCEGDSFFIRGKQIPTTAVYYDSLLNSHGCDSVIKYVFNVKPTYDIYDSAHICKGDYYDFDGRKLTEDGDYLLTYQTVAGCDSTIHLHLVTDSVHYIELDTTVCGNFFVFNNHTYDSTGIYMDTISTTHGCDSVLRLNLTLYPTIPVTDITVYVCQGDSFSISGKKAYSPGIYVDSLRSSHGCDSIVRFMVNILPTYQFYDTVTICDYQTFTAHDSTLRYAGDYHWKYHTVAGCDSFYHLHLVVTPSYLFITDTIACGRTFRFQNRDYTQSGTYDHMYKTVHGCDSIYRLILRLDTGVVTDIHLDVCQGDSMYISGKNVPALGIIYDTLMSVNGCDSIIRYIFNVHNTFEFYETATICSNEKYYFFGDSVYNEGDYTKVFKTAYGCDSTYHLHLKVLDSYLFIIDTIACGNTFRFRNKDYVTSGRYVDSLLTVEGCDSVYILDLTLYQHVISDVHVDVCDGDTFFLNGIAIPARGVYYDTLLTKYGCDSIVRYIFDVHNRFEVHLYDSICPGDTYYFYGRALTQAGDYTQVYETQYGCDSIYHLHLRENPSYTFVTDTILCGNTFRFRNRDYTKSGRYVDSLRTVNGCDSVYILNLRLDSVVHTDVNLYVCAGDSAYINGNYVPATGNYIDTLRTANGCDSIVRYIFNVRATYNFYEIAEICHGDVYDFHGEQFNVGGDHTVTFQSVDGCDSIYHLHLIVNPSYMIHIDTVVCGYVLNFNGNVYNQTGLYYDSYKTIKGCDSIYEINLIINEPQFNDYNLDACVGDSVMIGGKYVPVGGVYFDTVYNANGCYSVDRYAFNIHNTFEVFDTAHICLGESYLFNGKNVSSPGDYIQYAKTVHGCDSVIHLHLAVHEKYYSVIDTTVCAADPFYINNIQVTQSGTYQNTFKTRWGCDSTIVYNLTIVQPQINDYSIDVCNDDSVNIRGKFVPVSQIYNDTILLADGCYDIDRYTFNIYSNIEVFDTAHICSGDTYRFFGNNISSPGDYINYGKTVHGCDDIHHLHLEVHETYYSVVDITTCADEPIFLNNIQIMQSGTYQTNFKTRWGCDSTIVYNITINDTTINEIYDTICEGDVFHFKRRKLTKTGLYTDTSYSVHGCKVIDRLHLHVGHKYSIDRYLDVCQNELPLTYQGINIYSGGLYTQFNTTTLGCDSVVKLHVNVLPAPQTYDTLYNCSSDPTYIWNDTIIRTPGDYTAKLRSSLGCDSIAHLHYDTVPPMIITKDSICKGDVYEFRNRHYTIGGTYDIVAPASGINCDTIYRLILKVDTSAKYREIIIDTCNVTAYMFNGRLLTENGIYYDTVQTATGCNSITRLKLTLGFDVTINKTFDLCQGNSISFRGKTYNTTGVYYDTLIASTGCDSVYKIVVNVHPVYTITDTVLHVCGANDSAYYHGKWHRPGSYYYTDPLDDDPCPQRHGFIVKNDSFYHDTTVVICKSALPFIHPYTKTNYYWTGVYDEKFHAVFTQCDSIYHLDLTVKDVFITNTYDTICEGQVYHFANRFFKTDTIYKDTLVAHNMCDSISVLHLKMIHDRDTTFATVCQDQPYTWKVNNKIYTAPGYYHYVDTTSKERCPTRYVLSLTYVPPVTINRVEVEPVCADEATYNVMLYIAPGSTPDYVNVLYDQKGHDAGFKDQTKIPFTGTWFAITMPTKYQQNGDKLNYVRPDKYNVRFQLDNGVCDALFTEVNTVVEVKYPSFVLEQNWEDVVAVTRFNHHDNRSNDDSYTFSQYDWYIDDVLVTNAHRSYLYNQAYSLEGHKVHARLTRTGENYGVLTCPIYIVHMDESGQYPILTSPQQMLSKDEPHTSFSANESGRYVIYTVTGQLVSAGEFEADEQVNVSFPQIQGYFILHVETEHLRENYKILVY